MRRAATGVGLATVVGLLLACMNPPGAPGPPTELPAGFGADSADDLLDRWRQAHRLTNPNRLASLHLSAAVMPQWARSDGWGGGADAFRDLFTLELEAVRLDAAPPPDPAGRRFHSVAWLIQAPPPGLHPTLSHIMAGERTAGRLVLVGRHPAWAGRPSVPGGRVEVDPGLAVCQFGGRWFLQPETRVLTAVAAGLVAGRTPPVRPLPFGPTFDEEQSLADGKATWAEANTRLDALGAKYQAPTWCIRPAPAPEDDP